MTRVFMSTAMKRAVAVTVGALAGHCVGWVAAVCWLAATNNLMVDDYEARRTGLLFAVWTIIGVCTIAGVWFGSLLAGPAPPHRP